MLYTLAVVLLVLWLHGLVTSYTIDGVTVVYDQDNVGGTGFRGNVPGFYKLLKPDLNNQDPNNFIVLRYADVLLMYAEAQNEAVGPDNSVYEVLNKIRDRVGMPHITAGLSKDEMREEIRHERRIELAGEGLYYMDVRRWKIADKDLDGPVYNSDSEVIQDRKFVDKEYWWPIPTTILERNPALEQTSGY